MAPYFKAMPNSIDFYKAIFLHVIPVRIIVAPYLKGTNLLSIKFIRQN